MTSSPDPLQHNQQEQKQPCSETSQQKNINNINGGLDTIIHLLAGGVGGTAGAIITCPLEVVKTRLQSSNSGFRPTPPPTNTTTGPTQIPSSSWSKAKNDKLNFNSKSSAKSVPFISQTTSSSAATTAPSNAIKSDSQVFSRLRQILWNSCPSQNQVNIRYASSMSAAALNKLPNNNNSNKPLNVLQCLRYIVNTEGVNGLFKGLGPNLVGVAPSRAIYFFTYSTAKKQVNASLPKKNNDTPFVHVISAATAGFCASTCTNPIWLVKTRLQLDRASGNKCLTVRKCVSKIRTELGIFGFWKGVTASYWGISETMIHFVIYEYLKKRLCEYQNKRKSDEKTLVDFFGFMLCGACSKTCATVVAYPHEVARTRLREEGTKYRSFWQTLGVVAREEGRHGLYRGLVTQLIRQIPNTAIMMSTYELTVYMLTKYFNKGDDGGPGKDKDEEHILRNRSNHSQ